MESKLTPVIGLTIFAMLRGVLGDGGVVVVGLGASKLSSAPAAPVV